MSRRYISQMGECENIDDVFVVSDKQLRPNRNGNLYLCLRLMDRTGSVNAMMWNASDRTGQDFESGDYVRIQGATQYYNGNLQIILNRAHLANPGEVNEEELLQIDRAKSERHMARVAELLRGIEDYDLRNLAEAFLLDDRLIEGFKTAPAGVKAHHAYQGGLLEHVAMLMELSVLIADKYEEIDRDLLLLGAFLHDIGKIRELTFQRGALGYSDEGQLIGHLVIGIQILEEKIAETAKLSGEVFPREKALRLKHMIISHHGQAEFGSPKVPMTFEAIALRNLDEMDAKIGSFRQIIHDDVNDDSAWTTYQPGLGRKLFKGREQPKPVASAS